MRPTRPHDFRGYKILVEECLGPKPHTKHTLAVVSLGHHPTQIGSAWG